MQSFGNNNRIHIQRRSVKRLYLSCSSCGRSLSYHASESTLPEFHISAAPFAESSHNPCQGNVFGRPDFIDKVPMYTGIPGQLRMKGGHQHAVGFSRHLESPHIGKNTDIRTGRGDEGCPDEGHGDVPDSTKGTGGVKTAELPSKAVAAYSDWHAAQPRGRLIVDGTCQ